ncbi:MAG: membrane protein insertion efficiency factor YidD [Pseudomonadales bacterium]|nr:membrane protein insertion efficiency factor YidD [Pseudomonadales bacterium]
MIKKSLLLIIRCYQFTLSFFIGRSCRFYPTCSEYTIQAIEEHDGIQGMRLGVIRISKCHPFHPGGYDPVPTNENIKV